MKIHTVRKNETIFDIADEYRLSAQKIAETNGMFSVTSLAEGRQLTIITPTKTYNVKNGDTLNKIAERFNVKKNEIQAYNPSLRGKENLYNGQLLYLKQNSGTYGTACTNGYCYYGCTKERLFQFLPYLNYVTLCSAESDGIKLTALFDDGELLEIIKKEKKFPLLRIYLSALPKESEEKEFLSSVLLFLKSKGFGGVSFGGLSAFDGSRAAQFVWNAKKLFMQQGVTLGAECVSSEKCEYADYADLCILLYDKIHFSTIPSFTEGEERFYKEYAEKYESAKTFMDISSFAYGSGRYFEKEELIARCDRKGVPIENDGERLIGKISGGANGRFSATFENLENTRAKLELASEVGMLGVSFDVMRMPLSDITLFSSMFKTVSAGAYFDESGGCMGGM